MSKCLLLVAFSSLTLALTACGGATVPGAVGSAGISGGVPAVSTQDIGSQDSSATERQILEETNAARAQGRNCGATYYPAVAPVTWNGYLAKSARAHAQDMADQNYFSHVGLNGSTTQQRDEAAGYINWRELGENIEAGVGISEAVRGWINSPSHCEALMNPKYKELGVGYVFKPGTKYGTYWVQEFGSR